MDFIISLVVILIFVAVSMKKSGQLDEIMNGMKKKNQNEADNVVYEQTEDAPKKKKAKATPVITTESGQLSVTGSIIPRPIRSRVPVKMTIAADHRIILWYRLKIVASTSTRMNTHNSNRNIRVTVISGKISGAKLMFVFNCQHYSLDNFQ